MQKITITPFGGLFESELYEALVPKHNLEEIREKLASEESYIVQFYGKKGRGKTMHLRALQAYFPAAPIYFLGQTKEEKPLEWQNEKLVFVDSIHLMPFQKRQNLYFQKNLSLVFTSHIVG